jgi:uncharacterized protein YecT (DUF1311 family)
MVMIDRVRCAALLISLFVAVAQIHAQTQAAMNAEARADFERADADLNKTYQAVLAKLGDTESKQKLKEAQRAWIATRDAEAARATKEVEGGSMAPTLRYEAMTRLTRERIKELKTMLDHGNESEPKSVATDTPASETSTPTASPNPSSLVHGFVKTFLVFPDTESPNGRYAVAWGLPKHPEVWAKVCRFSEQRPPGAELPEEAVKEANEVFESVLKVETDVENYIVNVHDEKIIRTLHCPHGLGVSADLHSALSMTSEYWMTPGFRPNHHDLKVLWSPASDLVLINHTFRWDCVSFCAVLLGQTSSELDLSKPLGAAVRNLVAKSFPKGSGYTKSELDVSYSDMRHVADDKFSADAQPQVGRQWVGDDVTVSFTLNSSNSGKRLTLLNIHVADR